MRAFIVKQKDGDPKLKEFCRIAELEMESMRPIRLKSSPVKEAGVEPDQWEQPRKV
jgi:hypothetical protein